MIAVTDVSHQPVLAYLVRAGPGSGSGCSEYRHDLRFCVSGQSRMVLLRVDRDARYRVGIGLAGTVALGAEYKEYKKGEKAVLFLLGWNADD